MTGISTRAAAKTLVDTNLPSGSAGGIPAADHRALEKTILDSSLMFGEGGQVIVTSLTETAPPGSPADRVVYIPAATATGAWAGQETNFAIYDSGEASWFFRTPTNGNVVYDLATATRWMWNGSIWRRAHGQPIAMDYRGSPSASDYIGYWYLPGAVWFDADFAGSGLGVGTNPTSSYSITVDYATTPRGSSVATVGTITISTGGVATFATTGNVAQTVSSGNYLRAIGSGTTDATLSDIVGTLAGYT